MGKFTKGIYAGFSGRVGDIVGAIVKGQAIVRTRPSVSSKAPTDKQIAQRLRFKMVSNFLKPLNSYLSKYYHSDTTTISNINAAFSYHITNAVNVDTNPETLITSKIMISKGPLMGIDFKEMKDLGSGNLQLAWYNNAEQASAEASHTLVVLIMELEEGRFRFIETNASRADGEVTIELPTQYLGIPLHIWAAFKMATNTTSSNSQYLGSITVA